MRLPEIIAGKWGSNLDNQISVGKDPLADMSWVVDNDILVRRFKHRCGVRAITQCQYPDDPTILTLFFDGHTCSTLKPEQLEIRTDPAAVALNDGQMLADIWFHGTGPRRGPLESYFIDRVIIYVVNDKQLQVQKFQDIKE